MSSEFPLGWHEIALTDCLEDFRNGWTYDTRATDGSVPITRIETISIGMIDYSRVGLAQPDDRLEAFRLHRNDILFSHINSVEHIAKVAIKEDDRPLYHGMNLMRLRPNETVEPGFLFARLQSEATRAHFRSACKRAVNQASLNKGEIGSYRFALPPLDEQRRITEVLRSMDDVVAAQSALCTHLRQVADDLADELYAREIAVCDGNLVAYGDACETVQVGIVVKPASYYVDDGGVPALRSTNIKRNAIDYSALVQLSRDGHEINRKSALRAGDVVTIRTGEPGKTAVIADDAPSPLNCIDIIYSRPKPSLQPYFAAYFINSSTARTQITAMQGGLAQQHFNVSEMKKLKLPVPSLARQGRIIEVLDAAWQSVRIEETQLAALQSTKTALMSALLSGRVRVPA
jgi:type I restriction enzyme S subunit